jgi:hypothetical protein
MKVRSFGVAATAALVVLMLSVAAILGATAVLRKDQLPTFPTSYDDGHPLPRPSTGPETGPNLGPDTIANVPTDLLTLPEPARAATDLLGLRAYKSQRQGVLAALGMGSAKAGVTFRNGLNPSDAVALMARHGFTVTYVDFEIPGTYDHGGFVMTHLDAYLRTDPTLVIVNVQGWGPTAGLRDLATETSVWLVDPAGTHDYYYEAEFAHALDD